MAHGLAILRFAPPNGWRGFAQDDKIAFVQIIVARTLRLTASEIAQAVADYGRTLVKPPEDAFAIMNVVRIDGTKPPRWSVVMPVWTEEEGRSDLSVDLTVIEQVNGFTIELDDIHVR